MVMKTRGIWADIISGRNMELRDELLALRENTAQAYGHAEALKVQWQEIEKAQAQLYQVSLCIQL